MKSFYCFFKNLNNEKFNDEKELINYLIYKILDNSNFIAKIFCLKNNIQNNNPNIQIAEFSEEEFNNKVDDFLAQDKTDTISISTEYLPCDVLFLTEHTVSYKKSVNCFSFISFFKSIFSKNIKQQNNEKIYKQMLSVNKAKIIFTPSIILKNDIINSHSLNGQNVYILQPSLLQTKKITPVKNNIFTFYTEVQDNNFNDIFILLQAVNKLKDIDFKLKIATNNDFTIPLFLKYYIKLFNLNNKIEFLNIKIPEDTDCVILPYKNMGFGLTALKAMADGKIVLISSRCGIKDIIETDNNGFIFDITKNAVTNLKRSMQYILVNKDDFENMSQKAIYTASVYNFEYFQKEFLRVLNNIFEN